jgi:hypothetical protein
MRAAAWYPVAQGGPMDKQAIIASLDQEIARLHEVRALLGGRYGLHQARPRPPKKTGQSSHKQGTDPESESEGKNRGVQKGRLGEGEEGRQEGCKVLTSGSIAVLQPRRAPLYTGDIRSNPWERSRFSAPDEYTF